MKFPRKLLNPDDSFDRQMASLMEDEEGPYEKDSSENPRPSGPKTVLAIDDKTVILRTYEIYFKHEEQLQPHRLVLSSNPKDLEKLLREEEPDLIILDWMMPSISGLELLKFIRSKEESKHIPVIMATSVGEKNKIMECAKYGISGYMVKPIQKKDFAQRVSEVLAKSI